MLVLKRDKGLAHKVVEIKYGHSVVGVVIVHRQFYRIEGGDFVVELVDNCFYSFISVRLLEHFLLLALPLLSFLGNYILVHIASLYRLLAHLFPIVLFQFFLY